MVDTDHFKGKDALSHLAEKQVEGFLSSREMHGLELPGYLQAACEGARDMAAALLLLFSVLLHFNLNTWLLIKPLALFAAGFVIWKTGRAARLGWARLERLHRVLSQEKWEIEHNRPQEREELLVLYQAKGFDGKLLEDVVDVLMADETRLLKVMIEEEMGLSLANTEHPLRQGLGALIGSSIAALLSISALFIPSEWGLFSVSLAVIAVAAWFAAYKVDNRPLHAVIWALGIAVLAWGGTYFLADFFMDSL